jgi:hypothetical protein
LLALERWRTSRGVRFVLFALALGLCGCGGCVEDSSDQPPQPQGSSDPAVLTRTGGSARVLPRYAQLPSATLRDAGSTDE